MKFEITDKATYRTVHFTVQDENKNEYIVSLAEHDWHDNWEVKDSKGNVIDPKNEVYDEVVGLCEGELSK